MIDFRYHLISIVAVLLALAIGIFAGSGFLGGPLLDDLRGRLGDVERTNNDLRSRNSDLRDQLKRSDQFASAVEPLLLTDVLSSDRVVIIQFEGIDSGTVDAVQDELEAAGATVPSRITLTNKFALEQPTDRDQLALIAHSTEAKAAEVRKDAGGEIASAAATAGAFAGGEPRGASAAVQRWHTLVDQLTRAGFLAVDQIDGQEPVPPGSDFLVIGGSSDPAPYSVAPFASDIARVIASSENAVVVAEPASSVWGLCTTIRDDPSAAGSVATSDESDTVEGRIATVLGLAAAKRGVVGHYGRGPGADEIVPAASPGP